jgi:hypothetical protein
VTLCHTGSTSFCSSNISRVKKESNSLWSIPHLIRILGSKLRYISCTLLSLSRCCRASYLQPSRNTHHTIPDKSSCLK